MGIKVEIIVWRIYYSQQGELRNFQFSHHHSRFLTIRNSHLRSPLYVQVETISLYACNNWQQQISSSLECVENLQFINIFLVHFHFLNEPPLLLTFLCNSGKFISVFITRWKRVDIFNCFNATRREVHTWMRIEHFLIALESVLSFSCEKYINWIEILC